MMASEAVNRLSKNLGETRTTPPCFFMRLLLIEDDPALALTLQRSLERKLMQVQLCDNGRQAVAAWQAMQPDVVVVDLN